MEIINRLTEIEDELKIIDNKIKNVYKTIEDEIKELTNQRNNLGEERKNIIQSNCNHEFEWTGYSEFDEENDIFNNEQCCINCGLIKWEKF